MNTFWPCALIALFIVLAYSAYRLWFTHGSFTKALNDLTTPAQYTQVWLVWQYITDPITKKPKWIVSHVCTSREHADELAIPTEAHEVIGPYQIEEK